MNNNHLFKGVGVALVTPFTIDKKVDYTALSKLINHTIDGQVDFLVSLGTTGEAVTLTTEEKHHILDFTVQTVAGRIPIVAGFGGNNTQQLINDIKNYHFEGIAAILSASPAYNKPTQEGIYQHYRAVAQSSPVPIILYNVPGRTSSNMTASTTLRLAHEFDNIIAVKEASGNFLQCMDIVQGNQREDFLVLSGDDAYTLPMVGFGMDGVISVVANAFPKEFSAMVHHALAGNFAAAQPLHYRVLQCIHLLFKEGNPAGVKATLQLLGICEGHLRLPLTPISERLFTILAREVEQIVAFSKEQCTVD